MPHSLQHAFRRCINFALACLVVAVSTIAVAADATANKSAENNTANNAANTERRISDSDRYLSSDELEGRGPGTKGIDLAAQYIADQFADAGLKTQLYDGTPFQKFNMVTGTDLGEPNRAALVGPAVDGKPKTIELKLDKDFTPMAIGGSGKLDLPVVFVGYGITGRDEGYDDYAGVNVEGKAVIILRHEPQQTNPHSKFNGTKDSPMATFTRKVSNASEHGAAAVIFVTDELEIRKRVDQRSRLWQAPIEELNTAHAAFKKIEKPNLAQIEKYRKQVDALLEDIASQSKKLAAESDPLLKFTTAGGDDAHRIPVLHCRRGVLDEMLKSTLKTSLADLERDIDKGTGDKGAGDKVVGDKGAGDHGPTPHSREIEGWRLQGEISVNRREAPVKNVIAVLEGEGPKADETIVVGAHYDHLGYGGPGSFQPSKNEIHNGADDNGSGTAALIEVARRLASREKKLPRRIVFIAFTGEERGLIGSARYCKEPLFPLDKTIAMLNMDMVGRLVDEKLIIQGVDTAAEFEPIIDELNKKYGFDLAKKTGGFGPSDHSSFYSKQIPVMHYFTGLHKDYHRPSDDFEKVNVVGMRRVAELVADTAVALAEAPDRPKLVESKSAAPAGGGDSERPYVGTIPDFAQEQPGYGISGASKDSPADKAGMKGGDLIIRFGTSKITNLEDFDSALRKYKAGDKVPVIVQRGKEEVKLEVILAPPR